MRRGQAAKETGAGWLRLKAVCWVIAAAIALPAGLVIAIAGAPGSYLAGRLQGERRPGRQMIFGHGSNRSVGSLRRWRWVLSRPHGRAGLLGSRPSSAGKARALLNTARLRAMVFAAAGWPSSRTARASSASRMMWGSCRSWTGSEARSSQPSALAVAEPAAAFRRRGLKACPYSAGRSVWAGGLLVVSLVSAGVTVVRASARLARECGASCSHLMSA